MEEEIWKDIPNYEGLYQVSSYGRVKSFIKSRRYGMINDGRILKQSVGGSGYLFVGLNKGHTQKSTNTHKIVAITFLNNEPDGTHKIEVNHKDGNRTNNHLDNLELVTQRYNSSDGYIRKETTSKYTGVAWHRRDKMWYSQIKINRKSIHIGCFITEIEASNAYQKKLAEISSL